MLGYRVATAAVEKKSIATVQAGLEEIAVWSALGTAGGPKQE
jgi:hypothetical protein